MRALLYCRISLTGTVGLPVTTIRNRTGRHRQTIASVKRCSVLSRQSVKIHGKCQTFRTTYTCRPYYHHEARTSKPSGPAAQSRAVDSTARYEGAIPSPLCRDRSRLGRPRRPQPVIHPSIPSKHHASSSPSPLT
ncbi:hypothetical protein V8C26DRAFT_404730 [Trichoderma gracile]